MIMGLYLMYVVVYFLAKAGGVVQGVRFWRVAVITLHDIRRTGSPAYTFPTFQLPKISYTLSRASCNS